MLLKQKKILNIISLLPYFSDFKYFIKINKTGLHFVHNCNKWSFDG